MPVGEYSKDNLPPKDEIKKIIRKSMDMVGIKGDRLVEKNRQIILNAFNTLLRKKGKTTKYEKKVNKPIKVETLGIDKETIAIGNLRHNATVFYTDNFADETLKENQEIIELVIADESLPKSASKQQNPFLFKTPLDLVFTKADPERKFVEALCNKNNVEKIDCWIKSKIRVFIVLNILLLPWVENIQRHKPLIPTF